VPEGELLPHGAILLFLLFTLLGDYIDWMRQLLPISKWLGDSRYHGTLV